MEPDEFDAIRPYRDDEVADVVGRLVASRDVQRAVARLAVPRLYRAVPWLVLPLVATRLAYGARRLRSVADVQHFIEPYMRGMVEASTAGFSVEGLDDLPAGRACLFVGNHRDIALDSAFLNYALWLAGRPTVRIAIGDNLVKQWFAADLMRLNKSFIVKRGATGPKEMFAAYSLTSRYLHHCIATGHSVWIAQREGRAKDGWDRTEPAMIKMFQMSQRKSGRSFGEVIRALNIVPLTVTYEFDPCDRMKAHELALRAGNPDWKKPEDDDIRSIVQGIVGWKGRVHVRIGRPLDGDYADADAVATALDHAILSGYRIEGTHAQALQMLGEPLPPVATAALAAQAPESHRRFAQLVADTPAAERDRLVRMYANVLLNRRALGIDPVPAPPVAA